MRKVILRFLIAFRFPQDLSAILTEAQPPITGEKYVYSEQLGVVNIT